MLSRFIEYIRKKQLFESDQKVLLAVSGGIDSMVLLDLFHKARFNYGVVHCNFQLRGVESDGDEEFVKQQVLMHGVPSFFKRFDTREHARINGISIEMAARQLRYDYFEKVRKENNFAFVATAHHQDDLIETFFLNLSRKTGIKGLSGIKEKTNSIIRPLLFAIRNEIEDYARANFIEFREDHTNNEVIYQRNFIRHRIIPLFIELNSAFKSNLPETINNLREVEEVYYQFVKEEQNKIVTSNSDGIIISIKNLIKSSFPRILMYETLSEYNFHSVISEQVFRSLESGSGKQFYSKTHRLVKDRDNLFVSPLTDEDERIYYIEEGDMELFAPLDIIIEQISKRDFEIIKDNNVACLDMDKLEFPLLIRKWQQGDYFQPLGMTGYKKLSDFFIDEKIPVHEKEKIWILFCGSKIVWIMGYRIDNRFKITQKTRRILKIEIKKN